MSIFKKTLKYNKSSYLNEKIKMLDGDLQRTGVVFDGAVDENLIESRDNYIEHSVDSEYQKSNWRETIIEEKPKTHEDIINEEILLLKNKKNNSIKRVDRYISSVNEDYEILKEEIFQQISENFLSNIPTIEQKVDKVLEIYGQLKEGLLNEPPETKNSDPLTPLNQKFITVDELNKHYNLFINRIQEQVATIGGGGEYRLKYLDDIVGIATNASAYDGKFLKYNHSLAKFEFTNVDITNDSWVNGDSNTYTLANVGIGTSVTPSLLTINGDVSCSGIVTANSFFGDGSNLRGISPTSFVPYASAAEVSNTAASISGINSFTQVGILTGTYSVDVNDYFGYNVVTSADGKVIAIAALQDELETGSNYGVVYIFERSGNSFSQVGIVTGIPYAGDSGDAFGNSIALNSSGNTLVVGSNFDGQSLTGSVYIFDRVGLGSTSSYVQVGILTGSYATQFNDQFGISVSVDSSGKTIIVGAPYDEIDPLDSASGIAYVYDRVGNDFNQVGIITGLYTETSDLFGHQVSVSADGKTFAVSAIEDELPGDTNYGLVYIYDRVGNNFNQVGILTGFYAVNGSDGFGHSLALNSDGKTIVVGVPYDEFPSSAEASGVVYVYDRVGDNFNQVGILTGTPYSIDAEDKFGHSVAVSADGNTIVAGAIADEISSPASTGVVYIFKRVGDTFNQVGILTGFYSGQLNDKFGNSLAISADGKSIIVGAAYDEVNGVSDSGVVYVYDEIRNTYLYSDVNGNIGIGTSVFGSKLTIEGDVKVSGILTATDFNSASDMKLKENISVIQNPIDKLLQIDGVNFNWKASGNKSVGVIAQNVESILPEIVSGSELKAVNYNGLIALLIESVKQQQKEIEELKKRLDK